MRLIPRSEWGAVPPSFPPEHWAPGGPVDLVVHWVGGPGSLNLGDHSKCAGALRSVQRYEMANNYSDIAYSLAVCPHGMAYDCRGLAYRSAANGPKTNGTKPSVLCLLNMADTMTRPMQDTILEIRRTLTPGTLYGHREVNATTCPGNDVMAFVDSVRNPPAPPPPPPTIGNDDMQFLMRADDGTPQVWLVAGNTKLHLTGGPQGSYDPWLVWSIVHIPGATDPTTKREWIVPARMLAGIRTITV